MAQCYRPRHLARAPPAITQCSSPTGSPLHRLPELRRSRQVARKSEGNSLQVGRSRDSTGSAGPEHGQGNVDPDLWEVLDLASTDELEELHNILFGSSPLSPVIKSLVADNEPPAANVRGRTGLMLRLESRFRFLAADSAAMLRGYRPAYRETLLHVRDRLDVPCPGGLSTPDLEAEILLRVLGEHGDAQAGVPAGITAPARTGGRKASKQWMGSLTAPLTLGREDLMPTLLKLGSAYTLSQVQLNAVRGLGAKLVASSIRYEAALAVLCRAGTSGIAVTAQGRATVQVAHQGLAVAAARYGAARSALSLLGPVMWAWLGADLALKAVGTDYGRITRAVCALAQVRLLRTHGFTSPSAP